MKKLGLITVITLAYFYVLSVFGKLYIADIFYTESKRLFTLGEYEKSTQYVQRAIESNSREPAYYRGLAKTIATQALLEEDNTKKNALKQSGLETLKKAEALNLQNLATLRNNIPLYYLLALENIKDPDYAFLSQARKFYENLKVKYPTDAGVWVDIAKYEKKLGLTDQYAESVATIETLRPGLTEWHESFR